MVFLIWEFLSQDALSKGGKEERASYAKKIFYCLINDPPPASRFSGDPRVLGLACEYSPLSTFLAPRDVSFFFQQNVPSGEERRLYSQALETQTNRQTEHEVKGSH